MNRDPWWPRIVLPLLLAAMPAGCTSFAAVRSAEVTDGPTIGLRASWASPPGHAAGWFWSYDCGMSCDRAIASGEIELAWGNTASGGGLPYEVAAGLNGLVDPYIDGYVQLLRGDVPAGLGGRLGNGSALYGRVDIPSSHESLRFLFNPTALYYTSSSGHFKGLSPAVGFMSVHPAVDMILSVAPVFGWTDRVSGSLEYHDYQAFATIAMAFRIHPGRDDDR